MKKNNILLSYLYIVPFIDVRVSKWTFFIYRFSFLERFFVFEIERMKKMWENPPLCPHHLKLLFWCKKMGDKRFF